MDFEIKFSLEKNLLLKESREACFDDVLDALENKKLVANIPNFNSSYKNQFLLLVDIKNYIYVIPYVLNVDKKEIFFKTVYPSRKFTKIYKNDKN